MGMHRDQARKAAGRAKIAAAGLAAVGAVVLFAPFPKLDAAPANQPSGPVAVNTQPGRTTAPDFNVELGVGVLKDVGPEPRPLAAADPPPEEGVNVDPPGEGGEGGGEVPVVSSGPELRYLGPIVGPRRTMAMVALDGQQRIVAVGEEIDGKVIQDVAPTQIVLNDPDGVEHVLTRVEQVLDWAMDAPAAPPTRGMGSKKLPGGAGKMGGLVPNGDHENLDPELGLDGEAKRAEAARRLSEMERGGSNEGNANGPNSGAPRVNRPIPPGSAIPKVPTTRGATPNTPPSYPPARPAVPGNKGKVEEKKVGNQA